MVSVRSPPRAILSTAITSRPSVAAIAGWVPGYNDTARAAALHVLAKSASAAPCSADMGCVSSADVGSCASTCKVIPPDPAAAAGIHRTRPPHGGPVYFSRACRSSMSSLENGMARPFPPTRSTPSSTGPRRGPFLTISYRHFSWRSCGVACPPRKRPCSPMPWCGRASASICRICPVSKWANTAPAAWATRCRLRLRPSRRPVASSSPRCRAADWDTPAARWTSSNRSPASGSISTSTSSRRSCAVSARASSDSPPRSCRRTRCSTPCVT